MDSKEICQAAWRMTEPDDRYDLSDLKLYHAMKLLYAEFKAELCSKTEAEKYKDQLVIEWLKEKQAKPNATIPQQMSFG